MELVVDGESRRVLANSCIIANCNFAGGMRIAPGADCSDGLFDVVVLGAGFGKPEVSEPPGAPAAAHSLVEKGIAKLKVARNVPRFYRGTHIEDESVLLLRGSKVKVTSSERMVLQADGEVIGEGPFTAEMVKEAIDIIS
jgi:diacylglycerol kinase (ATP)